MLTKDTTITEIATALEMSRDMARHGRNRWLELAERKVSVVERLEDVERSGVPAMFSIEQVLRLFGVCKNLLKSLWVAEVHEWRGFFSSYFKYSFPR